MSNKVVTRRELLDRWRAIEEEDDDETDYLDHSKQRHIRHLKETWFSDAFNFLTYLPREIHIWCGSWDIMGPLLETFYNYFKGDRLDSPLKLLWKRISDELQDCMQCICQHHQAKDTYTMEYELSSIGPLLDVLCMLDEERVTSQLKEMNAIIARGEYDPVKHNAKVISVMYEVSVATRYCVCSKCRITFRLMKSKLERQFASQIMNFISVLMFPVLLDDQSLVTEFQIFIEAVDDSHELTLAGHQQYPGVYALLFLKSRRCRSIGFRLAGHMGKLRTAADLDPLQPLLKKCILILETEVVPLNSERSRPRMQLDRITVWLGIKALLGFLEPHAFEEGILERYPSFLSVVLNHISDDSLEFSYAINCLRLLFEMLGCKLWLRAALSPTVMRDTLLGQCFHTRDEKSHKEMFDLFPPFLQSLEALQDGEHKKQRRHFLYFLLHQVPVSSNFSALMRKKACQIALLIIHRGYKMNPCCPPFECAHMWGPSLVATLKDSSLYNSLRQPAFDLIQTIIVSDATALVSSILHHQAHDRNNADFQDQDDNEDLFTNDVEEKDVSCWDEFSVQSHITSQEFGVWMCIPMLWFDVLVEIDPVVLPVSFSKAVLWALSRFSMVEPEISTEMALPVGQWLATRVTEVSHFFGWRTPSGSDDGGNRDESKNSVNVATMYIPLIRTFRRLTTHFVVKMEQGELRKQWTWEPRMGESLILLLVDPDDNARQVGRRILEQVANTRGLLSCLQFLCSCSASISAVFLGLRHALQLLLVDSVLQRFQNLHHFFFVLYKLLKEGVPSGEFQSGMLYGDQSIIKFSSEGGFLHQPIFDTVATTIDGNSSMYWKKFSCLLSEIAWPSFCKCLAEAKAFIDYKNSQMTCIRMLEILPVVLRRLQQPMHRVSGNSGIVVAYSVDYKWLHDLMYWGKSSLAVVVRYWKQTVLSLLDLLKESCKDNTSAVMAIEKLIHCDNIPIDELTEQVWCLSVSSKSDINEPSNACGNTKFKELLLQSEGLVHKGKCTAKKPATFPSKDSDVQILDSAIDDRTEETVIILSDDEMDVKAQAVVVNLSHAASGHSSVDGEAVCSQTAEISSQNDIASNKAFAGETSVKQLEYLHRTDSPDTAGLVDQKLPVKRDVEKARILSVPQPKSLHGPKTEKSSEAQKKSYLKQSSAGNMSSKIVNSIPCQHASSLEVSEEIVASQKVDDQGIKKASAKSDKVIKELIFDAKDDPWEFALKSAKHQQSHLAKLNIGGPKGPKRHVIQLNLPVENRSSQLNRLGGGHQRFKPLRLDEWFKPILEMDYFASVGLASVVEKNQASKELKKVPVHFQSPDDYAAIFRPLVLEEFKAQLHNSFMEMASPEDMSCGSLSILSVERVDDFHVVRGLHDDSDVEGSKSCTENDIVLLTRQPLKNSSHDVHMVGKVERREKDGKRRSSILVIKFYLQNGCSRLNRAKKLLMERSKWQIHHIMNITPQLREFQALSSINTIPLLPTILNPSNQPTVLESRMDMSKLSQPMQQNIKLSFNDSQLQAISTVTRSMDLRNDYDLFLIQGPPGTGKTRTIVAIVSVLLSLSGISSGRRPENGVNRPSNSSFMRKVQASQSAAIARAWQDAALAKQLKDSEGKDCKATASHARGRVLICAQSNAAVDELVSRISSHGLYGSDGLMYKPYLVRVGNAKTVHPSSLPFFIDTLVDNRLMEERINAGDAKSDVNLDTVTVLRSKLEKLVDRIRFFEAKRANLCNGNPNFNQFLEGDAAKSDDVKETSDSEIGAKLRKLYSDKKAVYIDLTNAQALEKKANEERKALKHKLRKTILREAEIVITTLSGCGGDLYAVCSESMLSHKFSSSSESSLFDAVVIDEAAQALEPASLIPLQLLKSKGSKSIMVGDPKQLPATVLSGVASKYLYQCSMFERLQKAGHPVTMLTKQYRMHPEICRFPSLHFYDGNLLNGEQMSCKETSFHKTEGLGPYLFFDIVDGQELHGKNSGSLCNEFEADAAVELLKFFRKSYPSEFGGRSIGIITPYRSQLSLLRSRFSVAFGSSIMDEMELNTVDGFQGREVDILVLSTVRASEQSFRTTKINSSNIGFLADVRRMNVALTRAKHSLWILGNVKTLQTNENWGSLIKDAKERNLVFSVKRPYIFMNTNFKCDRVSENLHGISGQRNPKKRKNKVSRDAEPQKHSSSSDRERGSPGAHSNHSIGVDKNASLATRDVDITKKKARKLYDSSAKKDHGSFNRACKDVKSAITEDNEGQLLTRNIDLDKPSDRTLQEKGGRSSSQVEKTKDSICKRKKQREAVDALLPSAFISSKKNESSLKPVHNRTSHPPLRPSVHDAIRSTKPGKGKSVLVKRNSSNSRGTE